MSVFRGSFSVDAVAAVFAVERTPGEDVIASLSALVNASLVRPQPGGFGARYRLLDLVREYALERAEASGNLDALRRRHAAFYLDVAERAESQLRGAGQQEWHARLLEDESNFRAALAFGLDAGEGELALRLCGALWMFWRWAGLFREGRGWLEAAVAAGSGSSKSARLAALWGVGWMAFHQDDYRRTDEAGREMLALLERGETGLPLRNALTLVGNAALAEGRPRDAIITLEQALAACEEGEGGWHLGTSLLNLGTAHLAGGHTAVARRMFARAVTIYSELGDRHFMARTLIELGYTAIAEDRGADASRHIHEAMELSADLGDAWSIAEGLEAVASLCSGSAPETSAELAAAAEELRDRISMRPHPPDGAINQAHLAVARTRLGATAFEQAWSRGREAPLEAAIEMALAAST
jgi:tetratricopeptide (TPR) repeat protein